MKCIVKHKFVWEKRAILLNLKAKYFRVFYLYTQNISTSRFNFKRWALGVHQNVHENAKPW